MRIKLRFNFSSTNYPIGLDISDHSLKAVQLKKTGDKIKTIALAKLELPDGTMEKGEIKQPEEMSRKVRELLTKPLYGKFFSKKIIVCLPETQTFIKLIKIEKSANKIKDLIEAELQKHLPYNLNDIYYDWQIVGNAADQQVITEHLLVLVGAAPRRVVDQYDNFLDKLGLEVEVMEIEPAALCRTFLREESPDYQEESNPGRNYLIIDLGASRSSLIYYSRNSILFSLSLNISSRGISDEIAKRLKIKWAEAEKMKIKHDFEKNKNGEIAKEIISKTIDELVRKINQSLEYYSFHFGSRGPINQVLLTGGGANLAGIDKKIAEAVSTDTRVGLVSGKLDNDIFSRIFHDHEHDPEFSTAVGLALRGVYLK